MKNILFAILVSIGFGLNAQHTISGTFSPAKEYTWIIAYGIKPGTQAYAADTAIENGKFTLSLPASAQPGTYRLVYSVPQEEFYFDVIFNGKENIQLAFDAQKGVSFSASEENKIFNSYFKEITGVKQQFIDFYNAGRTDLEGFEKLTKKLGETQTSYEESTPGMLVHEFIVGNRPYIPTGFESSETYWRNKKAHYFDHLDLNNSILQASGFLTNKLSGYVFTAITTDKKTKAETEKTVQENINTVNEKLKGTKPLYQLHIFHKLWNQAASYGFDQTSDFIFNTYLKSLANSTGNQKIIGEIEVHNRLRLGAVAPEISWKDGETERKLSEMDGTDCYILIFWSSTCSHCLQEIPPLHKQLRNHPDIKVIAVGLEDEEGSWKRESTKLPDFEHAIALGKWESEYANLFAIEGTPTYFILDKDKRIIAKPKNDKEVVAFLEN